MRTSSELVCGGGTGRRKSRQTTVGTCQRLVRNASVHQEHLVRVGPVDQHEIHEREEGLARTVSVPPSTVCVMIDPLRRLLITDLDNTTAHPHHEYLTPRPVEQPDVLR